MEVILNYFMRTPSNKINETNSNKSLDDHIMLLLTLFFFCNHNFAVKINFFSPNHTKGKSSCWLIKLVYCKYLPHHWSHINWLYFYWKTLTGSYMAMCKFDKNKITYTMDKNFNGDVVSATNIMLSIKLYHCLMISDVAVASSDDN